MDFSAVTAELLERQPEVDMVPTLDRVERVMRLVGDPQANFRVIHVTGTNGKTSTARMIEAMTRAAGLRTGLYTSPHLHTVAERVSIDGSPMSDEDFVLAYEDIAPYIAIVDQELEIDDEPSLTFFEALTCLAYAAFADAPVDVAIVEVGLGGKWDATNVAHADVAVVNKVEVDHVEWLGADPVRIAEEKAGIIKPGSVAVLAGQSQQVSEVLLARCASVAATPVLQGVDFSLRNRTLALGGQLVSIAGVFGPYDDVFLPLYGVHQAENASVAVAAVESLLSHDQSLGREVIDALEAVSSPGRLEIVSRGPTVIVDAAHNPAGAAALAAALVDSFSFDAAVGVVSVMQGKDIAGILTALRPALSRIVLTANSSARATDPATLAKVAAELGLWESDRVVQADDIESALEVAAEFARVGPEGARTAVVATGSVITAADVREIYEAPPVTATPVVATMEPAVDPDFVSAARASEFESSDLDLLDDPVLE
jgi:dihydrofolate synthase/folylpolyglutamate synthase